MFFHRLSSCLLSAALLLALSACSPGGAVPSSAPTASPSAVPAEPSHPEAFRTVLLDGGAFYSTDDGRDMDLDELLSNLSADYAGVAFTTFALSDLDGDGTPEVLLREAAGGDDPCGFEVLRFRDGAVAGYAFPYRSFADLKADGTFTVTGGAYDDGYGAMEFTEDTWVIHRLANCETAVGEDGTERNTYSVCGMNAAEEDFQLALDRQSAKPDAEWHPYTPENVEAALSAPVEAPSAPDPRDYEPCPIDGAGATLLLPKSWADHYVMETVDGVSGFLFAQKDFLSGEPVVQEDGSVLPVPDPDGRHVTLAHFEVADRSEYLIDPSGLSREGPSNSLWIWLGERDGLCYTLWFPTSFSTGDADRAEEKYELYQTLCGDIQSFPMNASAYFIFDDEA